MCESRPAEEDECGVLKLGAVTWGHYDDSESKAFLARDQFDASIEVKRGDLLFCRKNTYELVAAAAYVFETRSKLMMSDLIFRLNPGPESGIHPIFLWKLLMNDGQRGAIQSLAGGSAGSMPNISKERLRKTEVIVPPMELQETFANKVVVAQKLKLDMIRSERELAALFSSLLNESYRQLE